MNKSESLELLSKEYIHKCKCCDECLAEMFCITNDKRDSRMPHKDIMKCVLNIAEYLKQLNK